MYVTGVGRYTMAVTSSAILALALGGCAVRSSLPMPPSPLSAEDAPPGNQTFKYTGKKQTFIVPAGVTRLTITASGASGGTIGSYTGGQGGLVKAAISVRPGESLSVFVGESGHTGTRRSFNGGGAGSGARNHRSAGGHGGSGDVCSGGTGGTGARHIGGSGGNAGGSSCYAGGGGGGGGEYGGGGGGGPAMNCGPTYYGEFGYCAWGGGGGGGGGASFIEQSATTIKNVKGGAALGDGRVVISW